MTSTLRPALPSGRRPYLPSAPYYDGQARDLVRDQYGVHRGVHPADAGMATSMLVRRGTCSAAPSMGNELHLIRDLKAPNLPDVIRSKVLAAEPLARLVANQQVIIDRIDHETGRGTLAVVVYYTNTDTGERGKTAQWYT